MSGGQCQGALPETDWSASSLPRLPEQTLNPSPDLSNSFFAGRARLLCVSRKADLSGLAEQDNAFMPLQILHIADMPQARLLHQSDNITSLPGADFERREATRFHSS